MESIYILIPIAMLFVIIGVALFIWSVKTNQFDDLEREAFNILFDDEIPPPTTHENKKHES